MRHGIPLGGLPLLGTVTLNCIIIFGHFSKKDLISSQMAQVQKCFCDIDLYKDDIMQYFISVETPLYVIIYVMQNDLSFDLLKL